MQNKCDCDCCNPYEPNTLSKLEYKGTTYHLRDKTKIPIAEKAVPNGVATLDENGTIPIEQTQNLARYASTADWDSDLTFVPQKGQIIVYSDKSTLKIDDKYVHVPGVKIGDGQAYLIDLPFVGDDEVHDILERLSIHATDTDIHITPTEREFWNNKLNYTIEDENLILNRL